MSKCPVCGASGDALFSSFICSNSSCVNHVDETKSNPSFVSGDDLKPGEWFCYEILPDDYQQYLKFMEETICADLGVSEKSLDINIPLFWSMYYEEVRAARFREIRQLFFLDTAALPEVCPGMKRSRQ
jgi:hypothetical protein